MNLAIGGSARRVAWTVRAPEVELSGLCRLRLRVDEQRRCRRKDLEHVANGEGVELVWTLNPEA